MEYTSIKLAHQSIDANATSIIEAPGSKSEAIRYIIGAFLCSGKSVIRSVSLCDDVLKTIETIETLGATVEKKPAKSGLYDLEIYGIDTKIKQKEVTINIGSSAALFRMIVPIALMLFNKVIVYANDDFWARPIDEIKKYVELITHDGYCVLSNIDVEKTVVSNFMEVDGSVSSQYASGVLFAQTLLNEPTELVVTNLESKGYLNMTAECLKEFGFDIKASRDENKDIYKITSGNVYKSVNRIVNGDYSQAAYFLTLGALTHNVIVNNLYRSYQADEKVINILARFDIGIEKAFRGYRVKKSKIEWRDVDVSESIDLAPILFVLASCVLFSDKNSTEITIKGTRRLAYKESDRVKSMKEELSKVGIDVDIKENECVIKRLDSKPKNDDIIFESHNDHRICMSLSVLGIVLANDYSCECLINGVGCVVKSYPTFFDELENCKIKFIRL